MSKTGSKFGMRSGPAWPPRSVPAAPAAALAADKTYEIEGDEPDVQPTCGEVVLLTWGDPHVIGGATVELPMTVVDIHPRGRVSGPAATSATMRGMGPDGQPVRLPPVMPFENVPYSATPRTLTWRHRAPAVAAGSSAPAKKAKAPAAVVAVIAATSPSKPPRKRASKSAS